jgi:hypothetical protein
MDGGYRLKGSVGRKIFKTPPDLGVTVVVVEVGCVVEVVVDDVVVTVEVPVDDVDDVGGGVVVVVVELQPGVTRARKSTRVRVIKKQTDFFERSRFVTI